jgi:hypothetical protein
MRLEMPICGAAKPIPGASYIVSNMSSRSCWKIGSSMSAGSTFFATLRNVG